LNLFVLDHDVEVSVTYHVDNHVNKIALETLQVLSTALWLNQHPGISYDASMWYQHGMWECAARRSMPRAYAPTHMGPLAHWCRDPVNYMWALRYGIELCKEHQYRMGTIIQQWRVLSQLPRFTVNRAPRMWYAAVDESLLAPTQLARGKLLTLDETVDVYRRYYASSKSHLHKWTKREMPTWLQSSNS
jgi:hypothetical protein